MAGRPNKEGLDYFELDCHMDEKVRLIQAEFGYKSFAIVVKLYQRIYGEFGYYCAWHDDSLLLFMSENGVSSCEEKNYIREVVAACVRRGIFSENLYREYGILTSEGVQKRYLNATSKREKVELKKEYLLISVPENSKNVVINSISDGRNSISDVGNSQSRVEKSKEDNTYKQCKSDALALFERLWKLYPNKKGKGQVSEAAMTRLLKVGEEQMIRCIERYKAYLAKNQWLHPQNGSTFFNSGYVDYLDKNYDPAAEKVSGRGQSQQNRFNNFAPRSYDMPDLERKLLGV